MICKTVAEFAMANIGISIDTEDKMITDIKPGLHFSQKMINKQITGITRNTRITKMTELLTPSSTFSSIIGARKVSRNDSCKSTAFPEETKPAPAAQAM